MSFNKTLSMINLVNFNAWLSKYKSACESGRKQNIEILVKAQNDFQSAWSQWSQHPEQREGLLSCIDALKSGINVFNGIYNHTHVFGGKRGKHDYGMLGLMAEDMEDETSGTGAKAVYDMFAALYADSNIQERYNIFASLAENRVTKLKTYGLLKETEGHLQGTHPASIYCWLHAPLHNYYFFTNNIVESCSQQLADSMVNGKKAIFLKNTYSFMSEVKNTLRESSFPHKSETELSAITCDFVDYVGMQILEAEKKHKTSRYWLLVSKPSIWSFNEINIGETVEYTLYNEVGNKRRVFENFGKVRKGEPIICYESSPTGAVIALAEIAEESNGQCIFIRKTQAIETPLSLNNLLKHPATKDRFSKIQGSLFEMDKIQYDTVVSLISGPTEAPKWHTKRNLIRFGAPGTGKSHALNEEAKKFFKPEHTERVTFHPEYTSFDFIGAYKPTVRFAGTRDEKVSYGFVPGPFARVLKSARTAPEIPHLLIIEEINRANAAAVFADTFQLLDRNFQSGESKYSIGVSEEFAAYLGMKAGEKLTLPKNMYIWATMNSADQGVFPIDTAFKRRWHFTYCGIDDARDALINKGGFAEKWNQIREHANKLLQNAGVHEDKQMGPFFLSDEDFKQEEKDFIDAVCNKVLMYLYEDAAKHKRSALFKDTSKRYSELCFLFKSKYGEDITTAIEEIFLPLP